MQKMGYKRTCVTISNEFYKLAKENNIKLTEALRIGLSVIFSERNIGDYNNNLNKKRKVAVIVEELSNLLKELEK